MIKLHKIGVMLWLLALSTISSAQSLGECAAKTDEKARLECFDALAAAESSVQAPEQEEVSSSENASSVSTPEEVSAVWTFIENTDSFTDKDTSRLALLAVSDSDSGEDPPALLVLSCDGNGGYNTAMVFDGYVGSRNNRVPVRYRFDNEDPISESWNGSTNGTVAFLPRGYNDFKLGILAGKSFIFEVTDFNGSRSSARFENGTDPKFDFITSGCR